MQRPTRRAVMAGSAATMLAAPAPPAGAQPVTAQSGMAQSGMAQSNLATGLVKEALPDGAQGPALAGVLVSNGREVVRTDAAGRYSLPLAPGQVVFVVAPAGYRPPRAPDTNLPRFSYVHDPAGTPASLNLRYGGLPPTGPLPASIDFVLTRAPQPARFDVILFTDPQPESTAEVEYMRDDVVSGLIGSDAAFGITCGDIAFDDLSMYGRINRIIGRIGLPWWTVGGNHDLDLDAPDAQRARDTYKRVFGAPAYAHEHGQALFIMLDNVEYRGVGPGGRPGAYRGVVPPDQLAFVENLLELTPADRLIVLVMHIPLTTYLDPAAPAQTTANAAELLKLVRDRPCVSFAGHTHTTEHHYLDVPGRSAPHHHHVLTAVSGSWWSGPPDHRGIACADSHDGTPNGYHVLSVDGTSYTTRFVPAAEPAGRQMRVSLDAQLHGDAREVVRELSEAALLRSPISAEQAAGTRVVVNLFDGGPRSTVTMAVDGGAPVALSQVSRPDPFVQQLYARHPATIKPWVAPKPSSHVWQGRLPPGLTPGTYALHVTARDEYGRTHRDGMVLEVV